MSDQEINALIHKQFGEEYENAATDEGDAFRLLGEQFGVGYVKIDNGWRTTPHKLEWTVQIVCPGEDAEVTADTFPMAACLCALKADHPKHSEPTLASYFKTHTIPMDTKPESLSVGEEVKALRLALESTGHYGPVAAIDPHDGSVQEQAESILATAIQSAREKSDQTGRFFELLQQASVIKGIIDCAGAQPEVRKVVGRGIAGERSPSIASLNVSGCPILYLEKWRAER